MGAEREKSVLSITEPFVGVAPPMQSVLNSSETEVLQMAGSSHLSGAGLYFIGPILLWNECCVLYTSKVLSRPAQHWSAWEGAAMSLRQSVVWEPSKNKGARKEDVRQ